MIKVNNYSCRSFFFCIALAPLQANAGDLSNATCEIAVNGEPFIVGPCVASFEEGSLILGSPQIGKETGLPLSRFSVDFDENGATPSMVMYNTLDMSRFASLDISSAQGDMSPTGGCLNGASFKACFSLDAKIGTKITPTEVFGDATEETRKAVQEKLQEYGYYQGTVDGTWGDGTEQALIALHEITHAFSSVDPESYWFDFDETGMRKFLADIESGKVERLIGVYSFCDNIDGHLLDVAQRQGEAMRDVVWQAYEPVAEKWCPLLFVAEGD